MEKFRLSFEELEYIVEGLLEILEPKLDAMFMKSMESKQKAKPIGYDREMVRKVYISNTLLDTMKELGISHPPQLYRLLDELGIPRKNKRTKQ